MSLNSQLGRVVLAAAAVLAVGCKGAGGPSDDELPMPSRILSADDKPLAPVRLPELRQEAPGEVRLKPPPGGDPAARAAVLGQAPLEKAVKRRDDGRLQLGRIIVDRDAGVMVLPGQVNQSDGIIEYFAVGPRGKLHESVLMLDVHPLELQVGALLIGLQAAALPEQEDPDLQLTREGADRPDPGAPGKEQDAQVTIEVTWKEDGKPRTLRAEDLCYNREAEATMERGTWVFTGSTIGGGALAAEFDQSYIATWPDRQAIFNSPVVTHNPYRGNGLGVEANGAVLPPKGTPVVVRITRLWEPGGPRRKGAATPTPDAPPAAPGAAAPAPPATGPAGQ